MDQILNTIAMLICVTSWVLCVLLKKISFKQALEVFAVGEAIRLTVGVMTHDWTQVVVSAAMFAVLMALWLRVVRKTAKGSAA